MKGQLIVLGATGCIGRKAVAAALEGGRHVVAVDSDAAALDAMRRQFADAGFATTGLVTLAASIGSDHEAAALADRLRDLARPVDGVIIAIGGEIQRGGLLDQPADFLRRRFDDDLLPHLFAARHLLPLLAESQRGGYVLIGGPGAEHPWAGYGQQSIGAAALRMLARVLHDEARAFAVRVQLLAYDSPARTEANARHACSQWPSADAIARHAVAMTNGAEPPDHAIVRYSARAQPSTLWSDDIDGADARDADVTTARSGSSITRTDRARATSQDADGNADPGARRSIRDARDLLHAITSSSLPQDISP